jgi:hypothetical protein
MTPEELEVIKKQPNVKSVTLYVDNFVGGFSLLTMQIFLLA